MQSNSNGILDLALDKIIFKEDNYKCITIDLVNNINYFIDNVDEKIKHFIDEFTKEGKKAIWLLVPITSSHIIHYFTKHTFKFHHTENDSVLVMYRWLIADKLCNLPNYATHYLGVAALILNKNGEILLVQEKTSISKKLENLWKIPTGLSEKGETIAQTVLREVKEETNLDVEYKGIINCRETHPYLFNTSDIFFICLCVCPNEGSLDIEKGGELKNFKWFSQDDIRTSMKENKFSPFTTKLMTEVLKSLPDEILNRVLEPSDEIKFLKSRMILHTPKY